MEVNEFNDIEVNNNPTETWDSPDNTATSDELDVKDQDTEYAKEKRNGGAIATSLSIFAISGVAILSGSSLLSSLIQDPEITSLSLTSTANSVKLETKISNPQGLDVIASLFEDEILKEETHIETNDETFVYTFENVDFTKTILFKISFSNNLDYSKVIFEKNVISNTSITNSYFGGNLYESI